MKGFGSNHIDYFPLDISEESLQSMLIIERVKDDKIKDFLEFIFNSYKEYTYGELIDLTHRESGAWYKTIIDEGQNAVIKDELIKKEFQNNI